MERTVKQIIISIILETISIMFFYSFLVLVFVNYILEIEILSIKIKPLFMGKYELSLGLIILIVVYLSYEFYKKIDRIILKDIAILMKNIKYDRYIESASIYEFKMIQKELIKRVKTLKIKMTLYQQQFLILAMI